MKTRPLHQDLELVEQELRAAGDERERQTSGLAGRSLAKGGSFLNQLDKAGNYIIWMNLERKGDWYESFRHFKSNKYT